MYGQVKFIIAFSGTDWPDHYKRSQKNNLIQNRLRWIYLFIFEMQFTDRIAEMEYTHHTSESYIFYMANVYARIYVL